MKTNNLLAIGLVAVGILILSKTAAALKFVMGDVISIGDDVYTVHGADQYQKAYLLYAGRYPNDTVNYTWTSSDYIDRFAAKVDHVTF